LRYPTSLKVSCLWTGKGTYTTSSIPVREALGEIKRRRSRTQPLNLPTSGSTSVGMKGYRVGGVAFSEVHANFLVNLGDGSFGDVLRIINEAKRRVKETFGVDLQEEVRLIEGSRLDGWKIL